MRTATTASLACAPAILCNAIPLPPCLGLQWVSSGEQRWVNFDERQGSLPLWKSSGRAVRDWLHLNPQLRQESPLLPTRDGRAMTRANVAQRLKLAVDVASVKHEQLKTMSVSPHIVRHSTAMSLLQSGVDPCEIALWLGHESPSTTHMYVEADLAMKERALARLKEPGVKQARYRAPKALLAFLQGL